MMVNPLVGQGMAVVGGSGETRSGSFFGIALPAYVPQTSCYVPSDAIHKVKAHDSGGQCIAFSPHGNMIASGGGDGFVKMWNTQLSQDCI